MYFRLRTLEGAFRRFFETKWFAMVECATFWWFPEPWSYNTWIVYWIVFASKISLKLEALGLNLDRYYSMITIVLLGASINYVENKGEGGHSNDSFFKK